MMKPHSSRLYASKLRPANLGIVKLKCLNVVRQQFAEDGVTTSKWADFWNVWHWERWIKPQIDLAASLGANSVKVAGSGIPSEGGFSYPSDSVFLARIQQFCGYARSKGMAVYWNLAAHPTYLWGSNGSSYNTNVVYPLKVAKWLEAIPNLVAIDCVNEINNDNSQPTGWYPSNYTQFGSDVNAFLTAVRGVTSLPLTVSIWCQSASIITSGWMQYAAPSVDFHDFHPYYSGGTPSTADMAALEAASWFRGRWLVGEIGTSVAQTSAVQTAWTQNIGQMAAMSKSFGAVLFCAADYDNTSTSNEFGITDVNVQNIRTQISTPFQAWGGAL